MAGSQALTFAIRAVNEASATLEKVDKDISGLGDTADKTNSRIGSVGKAVGGLAAAGAALGAADFLQGAAQAAIEDEAATLRLNKALENYIVASGGAASETKELMDDMNERIAAGQKLAFTDDEIRDSLQSLLAATDDYGEATLRQKAAMDLARGANIPLAAATKLLGKLNEDNVEVFKRMGIVIGENATEADALAAVQAKFGGQAETYAKSTAGQFEQSKIAMSELKEGIGTALLPVITSLTPIILKAVEALGKIPGPVLAIVAGGVALLGALTPVALIFGSLAPLLAGPVGAALLGLLAPIASVVAAFAAVIAIGVLVYRNWDTIKDKAGDLASWVTTAFGRIKDFVSGIFHNEMAQTIGKIALLFSPLGPLVVLWRFKDEIVAALSGLAEALAPIFGPVIKLIGGVADAIGNVIGAAKNLGMKDEPAPEPVVARVPYGGLRWGGARAGGGPVMPGSAYLVGENGPEIYAPGASGSILPRGGATINNYYIQPQGFGDIAAVERFILQVINGQQRRGTLGLA